MQVISDHVKADTLTYVEVCSRLTFRLKAKSLFSPYEKSNWRRNLIHCVKVPLSREFVFHLGDVESTPLFSLALHINPAFPETSILLGLLHNYSPFLKEGTRGEHGKHGKKTHHHQQNTRNRHFYVLESDSDTKNIKKWTP